MSASSRRLLPLYVAVSLATRAMVLNADIVNGDEASYVVGARELLSGHLPYTAFVDNKPPLVYAFYALAQLIGGSGIDAVRWLTALVVLPLTAFAVSAFYRHDRRGVVGALMFLVASASYPAGDMLAVNCEVLMMAPLAWAAVALRDLPAPPRRAFLAGLLAGIAILFKYQAVFWMPALMLPAIELWRQRRMAAVQWTLALGVGAAAPLAAAALVFALAGGFAGFWYWNVGHNFGYVLNPMSVSEIATRAISRVMPFALTTAVLWYGAVLSLRTEADQARRRLLVGCLAMSALACVPGFRFFPHYFVVLYVPLALASAPWLANTLTAPQTRQARLAIGYVAVCCLGFMAFNTWQVFSQVKPTNRLSHDLATRLKQDGCYGEGAMFVWGSAPTFYYHADLPLGARYFFPEFPLVRHYAGNLAATSSGSRPLVRESRIQHWRVLMDDLERSKPTYVIDTADARLSMWEYFPMRDYPWLDTFVSRSYTLLDTVDDLRIYKRNDCDGEQFAARRPRSRKSVAGSR